MINVFTVRQKKYLGAVWVYRFLVLDFYCGVMDTGIYLADCKSVAYRFGGSNPPSSTRIRQRY